MKDKKTANIIEIFSSVQGEGPYIGYRQIFIRFSGCNLKCAYCDTEFQPQEFCNIEADSRIPNPVSVGQLLEIIADLNKIPCHSISLTGGEPLLYTEFLAVFLPEFKKVFPGIKIYLETNGTLFEELEKIIDYIDIISMDLKLKSSTETDFPLRKHKKFIEVALNRHVKAKASPENTTLHKKQKPIGAAMLLAKAVITNKISDEEINQVADLLNDFGTIIPLVLQPVTSEKNSLLLSPKRIMEIHEKFLEKLPDVRVIPQVHKFLGLL